MSIPERPARCRGSCGPSHREGDLLFGNGHSRIATLVERSTRYGMLVKVELEGTTAVADALMEHALPLAWQLCQSPPRDRGKALADRRRFTLSTDIQVYSCDPQTLGSAVWTRTPLAVFGSTFRKASTCRAFRRPGWTRWPDD